ncbi:unnamed protein product [Rhizophagus irregularis]|nr:unnamed protein product [Rhizophagus irregularis]
MPENINVLEEVEHTVPLELSSEKLPYKKLLEMYINSMTIIKNQSNTLNNMSSSLNSLTKHLAVASSQSVPIQPPPSSIPTNLIKSP